MIELRQQHSLCDLLKVAGLSRSTFYYQQKVLQLADNYADVKERIGVIYAQHKGRFEPPRNSWRPFGLSQAATAAV